VSAARDPLRHGLLRQVGILSGLPMLLEALPRLDDLPPSVDRLDELWSTLCSGVVDAAFIGPWQVRRTAPAGVARLALDLSPRLGRGRQLSRRTGPPGPDTHAIEAFDPFTQETAVQPISRCAFQVLSHARPGQPLRVACQASGAPAGPLAQALHDELLALWRSAGLCLVPAAS
jgi:hypothetical protein